MKLFKRKTTTILGTIGWWEKNRIVYNIYMLFIGFLSFFIGYITIPLIYILIGLTLNIIFTFSWIGELIFIRHFKSRKLTLKYTRFFIFIFYGFSTLSVLSYSFLPELLDWSIDLWLK
ncbi:hypothetical protein DCC35_13265 [Mangrovivirga cuniculi]|uniref:Uncharacterized protein n=1 Tax=Mangrovivirga cuniculi TaxID=2715131 RepID=A0A4D7JL75_9BACT|nr:hypothetical protein DCC35_13265 [Mangrovivirga cuniculi]